MTATVTIPASPAGSAAAPASDDTGEEVSLMADRKEISINGYGVGVFKLEPAGNDSFKILDDSKKPAQQVGVFFLPTDNWG